MSITVPDTFAPSVTQGSTPMTPATGPWVSPMKNAAPGLLMQTAQTVMQAGETAARIGNTVGDRIQETFDDASARNAQTTFLNTANGIATRYTHTLGKDAIDGYEPAKQALDKASQDVASGLTNDVQKHLFAQMVTPHLMDFGKQFDDHQYQQNIQFGTQAASDGADSRVQLAANNYADWQRPDGKYAQNKTLAIHEAQEAALLLGQPVDSPQSQALVKQKTTALAQGVIVRMTQNEQYPEAQQYFDKALAAGEIDERAAEALGGMVMEGHNSQKGALLANAARQIGLGAQDGSQQRLQPVAGGSITSTMGAPRPGGRTHDGIDISVPVGTDVRAPATGTVTQVWNDDKFGGGLSMEITYPNGNIEGFAHLSAVNYKPGQQVTQGTIVASTGKSGNATGPVLHWAMKDADGNWIDPRSSVGAPKNTDAFTEPEQFEKGLSYINDSDATDRVKDIATSKLRSQYGMARELQGQKYDEAKQNAVDWMVQNGNRYDAMPPGLKVPLRPSDQQGLQDMQDEQNLAKSDLATQIKYWTMPPEQRTPAFVKDNYQNLKPGTFMGLLKNSEELQQNADNLSEAKVQDTMFRNALLDNNFQNLLNPKTDDDKQKLLQMRGSVDDLATSMQTALRRKLRPDEWQNVLNSELKNSVFVERARKVPLAFLGKIALGELPGGGVSLPVTEDDLHYGQQTQLGRVSPADLGKTYVMSGGRKVYLADIPPGQKMQYELNRFKNGLPITEQGIADDWVHFGMPKQ
ncbi:MAG: M23 family metallopeptidase [Terracidiphilus sp.]|nr:M23 family metallopeptidase [Terracidiphilus sp.]